MANTKGKAMSVSDEGQATTIPVRILALYDTDDAHCAQMLELQLAPTIYNGTISFWHASHIRPGDDVESSTREALRVCHIVILFTAPKFNQRYFEHLDSLLRSSENSYRCRIVPIYTRPCNWRAMPFGHLQCLPRDGDPVMRDGLISEQRVKVLVDELLQLAADERTRLSSGTMPVSQASLVTTSLMAQMKHMVILDQPGTGQPSQRVIDVGVLGSETRSPFRTTREIYKILALGVSNVGKTALTLKWANPLTDLATLQATKFERYERTASRVVSDGVAVEHVFQISDWGGEYLVDAHAELVTQGVEAIVLVVDLGAFGADAVDRRRIEYQLNEFQPVVLKFILTPRTLAIAKTVVLFINKCDLLSGTAPEVESYARKLYAQLIDNLEAYRDRIDVATFVGSAIHGHSTHALFAHLIRRVLPASAYDLELRQGTTK